MIARGVEHHELVRLHRVVSAAVLEAVTGARGDPDHEFADGVDAVAGGATLNPDQSLLLRCPPCRDLVDVLDQRLGSRNDVQASAMGLALVS